MSLTEIHNYASEFLETRRISDPYTYLDRNGELVTEYGEKVAASVETATNLGRQEYSGLMKLQQWFNENSQGTIIWISPPCKGVYQTSKIIVSTIDSTGQHKALHNKAIVLDDLAYDQCLPFAQSISASSPESTEKLREHPVAIDEDINWLTQLSELIDIQNIQDQLTNGKDVVYKRQVIETLLLATKNNYSLPEIMPLGQYSLHCNLRNPTTAFQALYRLASQGESLLGNTFDCPNPKCGKPIPSGRGIEQCPHCGITKSEYGTSCD